MPQAVAGSAAAQPGAAGAVISADGRATVTWQPGAVPVGATVSLAPADGGLWLAGTGVALDVQPPAAPLPWPVDVAYAAAPPAQVVGFSSDGKVWAPVAALTGTTLPDGLDAGAYTDGAVLHVLTRAAGRFALFRPGAWGDPSRVSALQPVLSRLAPTTVTAAERPLDPARDAPLRQLAVGSVRERVRTEGPPPVAPAARLAARTAAARRRGEDGAHAHPLPGRLPGAAAHRRPQAAGRQPSRASA